MKKADNPNYSYDLDGGGMVGIDTDQGRHVHLSVGDFKEIEDADERLLYEMFTTTNHVRLTPQEAIAIGEELIKKGEKCQIGELIEQKKYNDA